MDRFKELECIKILESIEDIPAGSRGVIVHVYNCDPPEYILEFPNMKTEHLTYDAIHSNLEVIR